MPLYWLVADSNRTDAYSTIERPTYVQIDIPHTLQNLALHVLKLRFHTLFYVTAFLDSNFVRLYSKLVQIDM